jgi:hypothetical protein
VKKSGSVSSLAWSASCREATELGVRSETLPALMR